MNVATMSNDELVAVMNSTCSEVFEVDVVRTPWSADRATYFDAKAELRRRGLTASIGFVVTVEPIQPTEDAPCRSA